MQLHQLQRNTPQKKKKRVGRGGKRGKTSGRGHKGQKARAGAKIRPEVRDLIKRLPKRRGHGINRARTVHSGRVRPQVVNLSALEKAYAAGETVSPRTLFEHGLITKKRGALPVVKILGNGALTKKLAIEGCEVSASAQEKIEQAGGSITEPKQAS